MKKRILSLLIVLSLMCGMIPAVSAGMLDNGLEYEVYEDYVEITRYSGTATEVVIPAEIEGLPVTAIGSNAFYYSGLTSINIPDSMVSIGHEAFSYCLSLTSINIPDNVTSIGSRAFESCTSLTVIQVSPNNAAYTSLDGILYNKDMTSLLCCPGGKEGTVIIPNGVTSINSSAFSNCRSLTRISIPDSVISLDAEAFYMCMGLDDIDISPNNPTYASLNGILYDKDMTSLLRCPSGKEGIVNVPENVSSISDRAFFCCVNLASVSLPDGIPAIGSETFRGCSSLTSVTLGAGISTISWGAFYGCDNLTDINVSPNNPTYSSCDGILFAKDMSTLVRCPGGKEGSVSIPNGVTSIAGEAFHGCSKLTGITIPDGVTFIGDSAFEWCDNVTSILIPDSVTVIERNAFNHCGMTSITIPQNVISIGYHAFGNCYWLEAVYFEGDAPAFGDGVFYSDTLTAYYPAENPTWTENAMQNYGGTITWEPYTPNPFTDVPADSFYEEPVLWALENGITTGASADSFNPGGKCLRAQVVTFLHRAANNPEPAASNNPFTDVKSSDFFYKPVLWAVEKGITNGVSATEFGSYANCNRAAVVTFLWRAAGSPEPTSTDNPFTDVKTTDFFYKPVLWAVENGITNGLTATEFGPTADCNRAQVVTFLYRAYN